MNVLFLATYGDFLATFEYSNICIWKELNCIVHCASNFSNNNYNKRINKLNEIGVIRHELNFLRSPFKGQNLKAYTQLVHLIQNEHIDIIDCHNAIVGAFARIAAWQCGIKKVIYTPHSFFFYKGCPRKNIILYKTIESFLARKTDLLILINKEDYKAAEKMKIRGKALYVPGVGINTLHISNLPVNRKKYCDEFGIPENATIFISVGELISRKNHICAIEAFAKAAITNAYYIICGIGELKEELQAKIDELGLGKKVKLLGYRLDVKEIMKASDIYIFPSFQEGLPVALMEAMACGIPCLVSKIRGNTDLIDEGKGGLFFEPTDSDGLSRLMKQMYEDKSRISIWGKYNQERVKEFDIINVQSIMRREYSGLIE